jgi:hypothetical protein
LNPLEAPDEDRREQEIARVCPLSAGEQKEGFVEMHWLDRNVVLNSSD